MAISSIQVFKEPRLDFKVQDYNLQERPVCVEIPNYPFIPNYNDYTALPFIHRITFVF